MIIVPVLPHSVLTFLNDHIENCMHIHILHYVTAMILYHLLLIAWDLIIANPHCCDGECMCGWKLNNIFINCCWKGLTCISCRVSRPSMLQTKTLRSWIILTLYASRSHLNGLDLLDMTWNVKLGSRKYFTRIYKKKTQTHLPALIQAWIVSLLWLSWVTWSAWRPRVTRLWHPFTSQEQPSGTCATGWAGHYITLAHNVFLFRVRVQGQSPEMCSNINREKLQLHMRKPCVGSPNGQKNHLLDGMI